MCSPAPVVLDALDQPILTAASESSQEVPTVSKSNSLGSRLQSWLAGWKQTLIAELASIGSPKEGFL